MHGNLTGISVRLSGSCRDADYTAFAEWVRNPGGVGVTHLELLVRHHFPEGWQGSDKTKTVASCHAQRDRQ
jgi:hypothetical protein